MEKEEGGSEPGSLTDLSSSSEGDGLPSESHRRYSSTSYILTKKNKMATHPTLATQLGNPSLDEPTEHTNEEQLPSQSEDSKSIHSDTRESEKMTSPLAGVRSSEELTGPAQSNETYLLSKSATYTRPEIVVTSSLSGAVEKGEYGHLFTEEEVKSLQKKIADMQVDIEQLLHYSQILVQENNALKKVLKDAVIVADDQNMRQFCDTLIVSVHEQPLLRSGVDNDHLSSLQFPQHSFPESRQASSPKLIPSPRMEWDRSGNGTAVSLPLTPPLSHGIEQLSSSHRALEVSVESKRVTLFKTAPLNPQATSIKGAITPPEGKTSSSQQAAESIRKLYNLTFTESQKERDAKEKAQAEGDIEGEREEEEGRVEKEASSTASRSGPLLSLRRSLKLSPRRIRHEESTKEVSRSQKSPDLPHYGSNPLTRRKTVSGLKMERPRFYLRDILPVLQEKNKLKEQVHLLETEVESLKSECGRLRVSHNTWLNRHSWEGVLVDTPEEVQTLSESPPPDGKSRSITMRLQPAVCDKTPYFTDAVATEYTQCGLHKVYSLQVTRSDGQKFELYRCYGEFFSFHHTLTQLFPEEAGNYDVKKKVLPSLPSIENVLMKSHVKSINRYCQVLLTRLDSSISRSLFVTNFFKPTQRDKQLPRLTKPATKSELDASDNFQNMSITSGSASPIEEEYVILADYTKETEGELNVSAGEVVQLINRDTTGWWLVRSRVKEGEAEKVGLVPGDFLKRYDSVGSDEPAANLTTKEGGRVSFDAILGGIADASMLYVAAESYQTQHTEQISFEEGTQFVVLEVCEDGWWLAMTDGKEGWVPASYLSPGTKVNANASFDGTASAGNSTPGLKYITMAAYEGQHEADVSFPECAVVDVISRSLFGWWHIRYNDCVGVAPASLLALTDAEFTLNAEISEEEKMALPIDLSHSISGYVEPPQRSQRYLASLGRTTQLSDKSST